MFVSVVGAAFVKRQMESVAVLQIDRELSMLSADSYKGDVSEWPAGDYYVSEILKEGERRDIVTARTEDRPPVPKGATVLNPVFVKSESGREWRAAVSADAEGRILVLGVDVSGAREAVNEGALVLNITLAVTAAGVLIISALGVLGYKSKQEPADSKG